MAYSIMYLFRVQPNTVFKRFNDDATAPPPAAPSDAPHICGCLRRASGSA